MGLFYNNEFNGWNIYITPTGIIYVGLFINNNLNGKGYCYNPENEYNYKGDFKNTKKKDLVKKIFQDINIQDNLRMIKNAEMGK